MGPIVSIIICTRNRAESLRATLSAIAGVDVPDDLPTELVIVDNASTDETAEVVNEAMEAMPHLPLRYIYEAGLGQVRARNRGVAEARGLVCLFTDDDVRVPANWIEGMCRPIVDQRADAVAGGVRLAAHLRRDWMNDEHRRFLADNSDIHPANPVVLTGANMAFGRHVLERVHGFDTRLGPGTQIGFGDDTMFSESLVRAGYRVVPAWDVKVEHHPDPTRLTRAAYLSMAERAGRTMGYILYHRGHRWHTLPQLRIWKNELILAYFRLIRQPQRHAEGIPGWESALVQKLGCLRQVRDEIGQKYRYGDDGLPVWSTMAAQDVGRTKPRSSTSSSVGVRAASFEPAATTD